MSEVQLTGLVIVQSLCTADKFLPGKTVFAKNADIPIVEGPATANDGADNTEVTTALKMARLAGSLAFSFSGTVET
ncbi:hypothetical protein ATY30_01835 [Sinorhizobium americanum]|uniref:Uncharacterized protein n=2 Tax=Sinorhizobium/Ensifer group TaxID=227292 RepID=A0A2S3YT21_9HYPH|nr:hypothetical protein CO656_25075 [Sinorhizobium sp. FG01]PDT49933.1 hypothetical protein CO664_26695 [Sinorhizobium sp. NG07B]POH33536.1 hypothetical protein ATY30_01835 [Sinorhizobium americanum]POH34753.1 hypothetical protein ATY31_05880 [Sinorhizobium americanum]